MTELIFTDWLSMHVLLFLLTLEVLYIDVISTTVVER